MVNLFDFIIHLDSYLNIIIENFGVFTYLVLFFIIFLETGIVITPFLPGDSLIFVVGAIAGKGLLNVFLLFGLLSAAAIIGDTVNYWIGKHVGEKILVKTRFFKKEYIVKTEEFYKKHGRKTIIIARFLPIIRTFAPFVAGIGKMNYPSFLLFNVIGGILWVFIFIFAGYFFGTIPIVQKNLTLFIIIIIIVSIIPPLIEFVRRKIKQKIEQRQK